MTRTLYGPERAHAVRSLAEYRALHRRSLAAEGRLAPWPWEGTPPSAFVSDGRWVCDCPKCGNGPSVDVGAAVALCFECGAVFEDVVVPSGAELADALTVLAQRPERNRNWFPTRETAADLCRENALHGLPAMTGRLSSQTSQQAEVLRALSREVAMAPLSDIVKG